MPNARTSAGVSATLTHAPITRFITGRCALLYACSTVVQSCNTPAYSTPSACTRSSRAAQSSCAAVSPRLYSAEHTRSGNSKNASVTGSTNSIIHLIAVRTFSPTSSPRATAEVSAGKNAIATDSTTTVGILISVPTGPTNKPNSAVASARPVPPCISRFMTSTESIICVAGSTSAPSVTGSAKEYNSFISSRSDGAFAVRGASSADASAFAAATRNTVFTRRLRMTIKRTERYISAASSLADTPSSAPATAYLTPYGSSSLPRYKPNASLITCSIS